MTVTKDQIRAVFIANGFTIKEGQTDLKPYVYDAAAALLALASPQVAPAPKPLNDPRLQRLFGDAIEDALSWGILGSNEPPEGHWLVRFWNIGRAESTRAAAPAPVAPPNLSSPLAGDCRTVGGFLSDVMTAAGLVEHGRQCKPLAERISVACSDLRARIFQGSAPVAPQDDARDAARYRWLRSEGLGHIRFDGLTSETCDVGLDWAIDSALSTPAAKPTEPTLPTQGEQSHD